MEQSASIAVERMDALFTGIEKKLAAIDTSNDFCTESDRQALEDIIYDSVSIKEISFIRDNKIVCSDRSRQHNVDISRELPKNYSDFTGRFTYTAKDQRRNKNALFYLIPAQDMWVRVSLHLDYIDFWVSDFGARHSMKAKVIYNGNFVAGDAEVKNCDLLNLIEVDSQKYPYTVMTGYNGHLLLKAFKDQLLYAILIIFLISALFVVGLSSLCRNRRTLESEIVQAIKNNEFVGYLQPIVCSQTQQWRGAEILLRWEHPHNGLTTPAEFITIAENSGLINDITLKLLAEAARNKAVLDKINPDHYLSLNVTASMIANPFFVRKLISIIKHSPALQHGIVLEFTERETFTDDQLAQLQTGMTKLRQHGVTWALDDFGSGYSGLSRLQQLSFEVLKIDRAFVAASSTDTITHSILDSICNLAKRFDCDVIAEGIETTEQAERVNALGIKYCQGYLFAKPMSFSKYVSKLKKAQRQPVLDLAPKELEQIIEH
ncbi:EAL domain-containing protein [Photobacterium jeanii]|nr:EAL domain-containing protein [Photobacterium jeanii]